MYSVVLVPSCQVKLRFLSNFGLLSPVLSFCFEYFLLPWVCQVVNLDPISACILPHLQCIVYLYLGQNLYLELGRIPCLLEVKVQCWRVFLLFGLVNLCSPLEMVVFCARFALFRCSRLRELTSNSSWDLGRLHRNWGSHQDLQTQDSRAPQGIYISWLQVNQWYQGDKVVHRPYASDDCTEATGHHLKLRL